MSTKEDLEDDDYVAKLLVEDARKSSTKYSSMGLSALLPKRDTGTPLKPNTRFLKNLVREADSHNSALKRKEELEARIRLRKIKEAEISRRSGSDNKHERRHDRDRSSERKRRRLSDDRDDERRARHERHERKRDPRRSRSPGRERSGDRESKRSLRPQHDRDCGRDHHRHNSRRHKSSRRPRSRSDSRSGSRERRERQKSKSVYNHASHTRPRPLGVSQAPVQDETDHDKPGRRGPSPPLSLTSSSSDPLSPLIGPKPDSHNHSDTTTRRGRGFHADHAHETSNIDAHFSSGYNPSKDPSDGDPALSDDNEWTSALEALRDRRAWRSKQAERLREAGFAEDDIKRWESSSSRTRLGAQAGEVDGDIGDVRWRKQGEEKEWDIGKVKVT